MKLTQKIQSLKETIKDLEQLKNNDSAELVSLLLKRLTSMLEEVDQRLTALEKKLATNHDSRTPS